MKYLPLLTIAIVLTLTGCKPSAVDTISLSGTWAFQIDTADQGESEQWFNSQLSDEIRLPGSMVQNGKGFAPTLETKWTASIYDSSWYFDPRLEKFRDPERPLFPFMLTPKKEYVGAAWYQKEVSVPAEWAEKRIILFLERAHWETTIWVDDQFVGSQNSLVAPHEYDLTSHLSPGLHTITMRVDNSTKKVNVGQDSHSISDHTQGNWNGIIGKIELRKSEKIWIEEIQVFPDLTAASAKIELTVENNLGNSEIAVIRTSANSFNSSINHLPPTLEIPIEIPAKGDKIKFDYPMGSNFLTWDEFNPTLYQLVVEIEFSNGKKVETNTTFGMREFKTEGTRFFINNRPVFLRGNCDCAIFPLTGHPPMDVKSWESIFSKQKAYGINHVRFHSWSPPEAAFLAADKLGIYLQPEGPSWANHGASLGNGLPIDQYIYDETSRINKYFGNSPSFCMLAYGNEPAGRHQAEYLNEFVTHWKEKDSRHVYTGASVGKSWPYVDSAQFIVKSYPRNVPVSKLPNSSFDHRKYIEAQDVPYVSHEIGQYCVFPNFKEIEKYTGVFEARNFEMFRKDLQDHGMLDQAEDFLMASGKLQSIFYKAEIEAALRTPGFGGFQMLQLNDFPGQGTALVGILDAFFEEKGYIDSTDFTQFCDQTVILARLPKFVFQNNEVFSATLELSHFGISPLTNETVEWQITTENGETLESGSFGNLDLKIDNAQPIGNVHMDLSKVPTAQKLMLQTNLKDSQIKNKWEFWVYPETLNMPEPENLIITNNLTNEVKSKLENGASVFLLAAGQVEHGKEVAMHFKPVFWNTSWFKMRPPHTLGHLTQAQHPAFADFPTDIHSNYQWWEIVHRQQVMILDDFPTGFKPLVQPIDTWFLNRKLGLIFECKVGKGKILVCSADLTSDWDTRFVSRQLYYSLINYMNSGKFNPKNEVDLDVIEDIFLNKERAQFKTYANESPDELQPKLKK